MSFNHSFSSFFSLYNAPWLISFSFIFLAQSNPTTYYSLFFLFLSILLTQHVDSIFIFNFFSSSSLFFTTNWKFNLINTWFSLFNYAPCKRFLPLLSANTLKTSYNLDKWFIKYPYFFSNSSAANSFISLQSASATPCESIKCKHTMLTSDFLNISND